jgi:hypothetical protein
MNPYNPLKSVAPTEISDSPEAALIARERPTEKVLSVRVFKNLVEAISAMGKCPKSQDVQYDVIPRWGLSHAASAFLAYERIRKAHEPRITDPARQEEAACRAGDRLRQAAQTNIAEGRRRIAQGSASLENPLPAPNPSALGSNA